MELLLNAISILFAIFWIVMLVNAAQTKQWGWFVASLIFPVVALAYRVAAYRPLKEIRADAQRRSRQSQRRAQTQRGELNELRAKVESLESDRGARSN